MSSRHPTCSTTASQNMENDDDTKENLFNQDDHDPCDPSYKPNHDETITLVDQAND